MHQQLAKKKYCHFMNTTRAADCCRTVCRTEITRCNSKCQPSVSHSSVCLISSLSVFAVRRRLHLSLPLNSSLSSCLLRCRQTPDCPRPPDFFFHLQMHRRPPSSACRSWNSPLHFCLKTLKSSLRSNIYVFLTTFSSIQSSGELLRFHSVFSISRSSLIR